VAEPDAVSATTMYKQNGQPVHWLGCTHRQEYEGARARFLNSIAQYSDQLQNALTFCSEQECGPSYWGGEAVTA